MRFVLQKADYNRLKKKKKKKKCSSLFFSLKPNLLISKRALFSAWCLEAWAYSSSTDSTKPLNRTELFSLSLMHSLLSIMYSCFQMIIFLRIHTDQAENVHVKKKKDELLVDVAERCRKQDLSLDRIARLILHILFLKNSKSVTLILT